MDRVQQDRLAHLESKLDELDAWVRIELTNLDQRIERKVAEHKEMLVERAAKLAVKQAFTHLGVDVDDPKDLQQFRDDLRFGGVFRHAATKGFFAVLAAIFGGIGLSLWLSFKEKMGWP